MIRFSREHTALGDPVLQDDRILLRPARAGDGRAWRSQRIASRAHLTRWEPDWRNQDMTDEALRLRLKFQERERKAGTAMPLLILRQTDGALIGGINLIAIRYHASRSATLGYWIGKDFLRCGFAAAAVDLVRTYAFDTLSLHRLEAATRPDNIPSRRLLEKAGFHYEGLARGYLHINGAWRDHCIYGLLATD